MQITCFGTATVLTASGDTRILFDPFCRMNRKLETLKKACPEKSRPSRGKVWR